MIGAPYLPPSDPIQVLYEDTHLIVIDKPAGLLSVPGRGPEKADCASARMAARFGEVHIVHRLDMATSGLLMFARTKDAQRAASAAFATGQVEKRYIADIWGAPHQTCGHIDLPLIADWPNRPRQMVCHDRGKPSQTEWTLTKQGPEYARICLRPITGRSHQLRVHMMAIGHPILGDQIYAPPDVQAAASRLHLHAAELTFRHPVTGVSVAIQSSCPF